MATLYARGRVLRDWSLSLASLGLLVLTIGRIDPRVQGVLASWQRRPGAALGHARDQAGAWVGAAIAGVTDQTLGHASLVLFMLVGIALLVVMLRIHH